MLYLERIGAFVPPTRASVSDLRGELGLTESKVRLFARFLGLEKIAVAPDLDLVQMLVPAARAALGGTDPATVRAMVHTQTVHHALPGKRALGQVAAALGLVDATAFAVSHQNCVASIYAVRLARYLLAGEPRGSRVLVTAGEKIASPALRLIPDTSIMGEAAAAYLVNAGAGGDEVLATGIRTLGRFYRGSDCSADELQEYRRCYVDTLATVLTDALSRAGVGLGEFAAIMPHNVNRVSWQQVADCLGISLAKVYLDTLPALGHCFGADPFINLADARATGRVGPGDIVVLVSAGLGATFAALVLRLGQEVG
ncbi:3-oxoacyl-[acyl-carrier-protein] synthase III C-terminal domain-containing protein [Actinokineospora sp.]|uniref:3-oxoacyl-[acyl-carrier-protein] synthase III C-terminal domain-containing protein n=1 Tax=Actinokineospora sp. TaxID=1872133 RepID=UPI004037E265